MSIKRKYLKFKGNKVWVTEGIGIEINGEGPIEEINLDNLSDEDFKHVRDTKKIDKIVKK